MRWWAAVGAFFVALQAYIYISWYVSGDVHRIPTGVTPVPGYMKGFVLAQQIIFPVALVLMLYFIVIRPWRREGTATVDGLIFLAFGTVVWQDPLISYFSPTYTYNSAFWNLGSWAGHIPGWQSANPDGIANPVIWEMGCYLVMFLGGLYIGSNLMKRAKNRFPRLPNPLLIAGTFVFYFIVDLIMEGSWMRTGAYVYAGSMPGFTISWGHYYQFPIQEALFVGVIWTGWACVRYFRDDRGRTVVERGIDRLQVRSAQKVAIRFLAFAGIFNVVFLAGYNIPWQWFSLQGEWPKDIMERSYFTNGVCGDGTTYACPTHEIPMNKGDRSVRIAPDGTLVIPPGVTPPQNIKHKTE